MWNVTQIENTDVHVFPMDDLVEHTISEEDCTCGTETVPVERNDGSIGWIVRHHSLDGREKFEKEESE